MNGWLLLLPVTAACISWGFVSLMIQFLFHPVYPKKIMGFTFQGIVPQRQASIAGTIGQLASALLSMKEIEEKIAHPDNIKMIMPQAEAHIDNFLRVKLVKSMPVVGMFVGDKTINQLKSLFITELEQLFPEIMKNYIDALQQKISVEKIITGRVAAYPAESMEAFFLQIMKRELRMFKLMGAMFGFLIGLLQLVIMLAIAH